jgi:hypothetical protein
MGDLRSLSSDKNVHMLYTTSNLAEIYVYDTLKKSCNADLESIYNINTKSDVSEMLELVNMQAYLADKWLFIIDFSKLKSTIKNKKGIFSSDTAKFLIKVKNYKDYKEFKELYPSVNDLYLSVIRENDVNFLLRGLKLSPNNVSFISRSYSRDPDKVFLLRKEMQLGYEVNSQKDIVNLCGESSGSIVHFAIRMLTDNKRISRGFVNRMKTVEGLVDAYGISTFKNFLTSSVKDILDIKMLYMEGVIYKTIRELPDCYDEKRLSRLNFYLRRIAEDITYERILELYTDLKNSGRWTKRIDILEFMYKYYGGL